MARPTRRRDPFRDGQTTAVTVVEQSAVDLYFNYATLPEEKREVVRRSALTIKPRLKRAAEDIFVIGSELLEVKTLLPHGLFTEWLDVEFGLSDRMAQHFMNVRGRLGPKSEKFSVLPPSSLYLLAAPSTPDEVIRAVEDRLEAGDRLTGVYIQRMVASAKQDAKGRAGDVVEGEVISSRTVDVEVDEEAVGRLEDALTQAFDLLSGQAGDDWAALFRNSELTRVRNEIYRLREELRKRILGKSSSQ